MGFPPMAREPSGLGITITQAGSRTQVMATGSSYPCPRCKTRAISIPSQCAVCGLQLASAAQLARSYHHLYPVPPYVEVGGRRHGGKTGARMRGGGEWTDQAVAVVGKCVFPVKRVLVPRMGSAVPSTDPTTTRIGASALAPARMADRDQGGEDEDEIEDEDKRKSGVGSRELDSIPGPALPPSLPSGPTEVLPMLGSGSDG